MNDTPFPFERTTCACEGCRKCCKVQPGPLIPGDLQRIAEFLKLSVEEARKFFVASPGALVKQHGEVRRIGTITPKMRHSRCVFLDKNERCKIHPVAPAGCAYFDTHMSREQAQNEHKTQPTKRSGCSCLTPAATNHGGIKCSIRTSQKKN